MGRDKKQSEKWTENHKEIIFALMKRYPQSLRISDIHTKTGIRKSERIRLHLKELEEEMVVEEVHRGSWRIHPSTFNRISWQEIYEVGGFTPKRLLEQSCS